MRREGGLDHVYTTVYQERIVRDIDGIEVVILGETYNPSHDSYLLSSSVRRHGRVVDLGCGSGYLTVKLVMTGNEVIAIDLSPYAVLSTKETLQSNNLYGVYVHVIQGDGLRTLRPDKFVDAVYVNPPYLPVSEFDYWLGMAWSGGSEGVQVFLRMLDGICELLKELGSIYFILSTCSNIGKVTNWLTSNGFEVTELREECFFMECIKLLHASRVRDGYCRTV